MSEIVEKTLSAIPKFFSENLLGSAVSGPPSPKRFSSKGFQKFVQQINRARTLSLDEEGNFVKYELSQIKQRMSRGNNRAQKCDDVCRMVYCKMLGYNVKFGYLEALKLLSETGTNFEKKWGYTAAILLLQDDDEIALLCTSTMMKDLKSTNLLENCASLNAICYLLYPEMITTMLSEVQQNLRHPREIVRAKAVHTLHSFLRRMPSLIDHIEENLKQTLLDKDPSVMAATVTVYHHLIIDNPEKYEDLLKPMIDILQQIISHSLPASFEYHGIPLPWLQIKLLRILAVLGRNNERGSQAIYPVTADLLQKTNMKEKMAFAIMYECIQVITTIHPNTQLLEVAALRVKKFVSSKEYTLKYLGVQALTNLIKASPKSAVDCQRIVVELLDDTDPVIQRKTLDLLYGLANPANAEVVCNKLLEHLSSVSSADWRKDLMHKILSIADRFASTGQWYFNVVVRVMSLVPSNIHDNMVDQVINVMQQNSKRNTVREKDYHQHLVKKSVECLFIEKCSDVLIQLSVWVLGEHAVYLKNMPEDKIISLLKSKFLQHGIKIETKIWILNAILKLISCKILKHDNLNCAFSDIEKKEENILVKQKIHQMLQYSETSVKEEKLWNKYAVEEMDFSLSFLDEHVLTSLENGAEPYQHYNQRHKPSMSVQENAALFDGLADSSASPGSVTWTRGETNADTNTNSDSLSDRSSQRDTGINLKGVKKVWGKDGIIKDEDRNTELYFPSDTITTDQSRNEEEERKKKLAASLFAGFDSNIPLDTPKEVDPFFKDEVDSDNTVLKPSQGKDEGGWRKLHIDQTQGITSTYTSSLQTNQDYITDNSMNVTSLSEESCEQPDPANYTDMMSECPLEECGQHESMDLLSGDISLQSGGQHHTVLGNDFTEKTVSSSCVNSDMFSQLDTNDAEATLNKQEGRMNDIPNSKSSIYDEFVDSD